MIKLTVDASVLNALKAAFPKPERAAQRALDKYVETVELMLFESMQHQQTLQNKKLGLFSISLQQLANRGGQIGSKKTRMHSWLKANNLEIIETVELGNKFTGQVSQVKLSKLATMTNTLDRDKNILKSDLSNQEFDAYLSGNDADNWAIFNLLYPDYKFTWTATKTNLFFDELPVDQKSLKGYIDWLVNDANLISKAKIDTYLRQALIILAIAQVNSGVFLQRKKPSSFGRMYYEGISVQSINKEMRRSVLGNCWEYDIRSSVVAWKMGFALEFLHANGITQNVREVFKSSVSFLEDKADFMATVRYFTFPASSNVPRDLQIPLLKQAFTALSFGARLSANGWVDSSGQWTNPALRTILKNDEDRNRFITDSSVTAFIKEQRCLDNYLYESVKKISPKMLERPDLKTPSSRTSKSKVLALLYQHSETQVMDIVCDVARQYGHTPIARVHDAIFFKQRLGVDLKTEIEYQMQQITDNPFWHLTPKKLERYQLKNRDAIKEELEHKKRMSALEQLARERYRKYFKS